MLDAPAKNYVRYMMDIRNGKAEDSVNNPILARLVEVRKRPTVTVRCSGQGKLESSEVKRMEKRRAERSFINVSTSRYFNRKKVEEVVEVAVQVNRPQCIETGVRNNAAK